jgi:SPP1 gp7 family putative phage head morphogenesis protein
MSKIHEIKSLEDIAKAIKRIFTFEGIKVISDAIIKNMFVSGWESAEKQMDRNLLMNKDALNFIQEYTFNNIKGMTDEVMLDLRQELERGIMNGEGVAKIKDRVGKVFDVGSTRAEAIARTETTRAENQGKLQAFKSSGKDMKKKWLAAMDDRTSDICKRLNGQVVGMNENFKDKQTNWEGPCPPSHVNCRSSVLYLMEDEQ